MPRPPKQIKRSILESRNGEVTKNERDLENTKLRVSEKTSSKNAKRINDDKPFFKLVLPPDLSKDPGNSSEEMSLKRNPSRSTKIRSIKDSPAIEILSSSGEEEFFHRSSTKKMGHSSPTKILSSAEDNMKSLLGENSFLAHSNELSQGQNLSTPRRYESKTFLIKQKQEKDIEMNSEDSDGDPFGFRKAEKRNMKRKARSQFDKISGDSEKIEVTTINKDSDNVQSEMVCQSISLYKENDANGSNELCEINKQDWTHIKQEYNASVENGKDDNNQVDNDNNQPIHDEDHLSTEIDKESLGMTPIKTQGDKNKEEEKKMPNATSSKVRKTSNITKTADLISLLPRRRRLERASKNKIDNYSDIQLDDEEEMSLGEEERDEEKTQKRKLGKMQSEKSEKRKTRKIKKEPFNWESEELDEKTKQELVERIRHTEEIDSFVLVEEVVD